MNASESKPFEKKGSEPRSTITISRQLGSMGSDIARAAADRLGYRVVYRELINQAAIRAGVPEMALSAIDELGLLGVKPSRKARYAYRQAVQQIMEELAVDGNVVIVGRAGQVILSGRPEVLHIRIIAPSSVRAERIAVRKDIPIPSAMAQVEASDRYRNNFMRRFYHVHWDNTELYDLTINTARVSVQDAADLICQALSCLQKEPKTPSVSQES